MRARANVEFLFSFFFRISKKWMEREENFNLIFFSSSSSPSPSLVVSVFSSFRAFRILSMFAHSSPNNFKSFSRSFSPRHTRPTRYIYLFFVCLFELLSIAHFIGCVAFFFCLYYIKIHFHLALGCAALLEIVYIEETIYLCELSSNSRSIRISLFEIFIA